MKPVIYYRGKDFERDELPTASKYFKCVNSILDLSSGDLCVSRYALWPFFKDQERDIVRQGAVLINSIKQHIFVADLKNYVQVLGDMTPRTWDRLQDIPDEGPFILKGGTNSRKFEWSSMMFAKNKTEASIIHSKLCGDSLIGSQDIYIRQYVPLKTYMTGFNGLPITKEFRFFVAYGEVLSGGYYWSSHVEDLPVVPSVDEVPEEFLALAIKRIGDQINFYTLDVAQTETGEWIIIECNDGTQSGPSENNLDSLYGNLRKAIDRKYQSIENCF